MPAAAQSQSQSKESFGLYNKSTATASDTYTNDGFSLYEGSLRGTGGGGGGFDDGGGDENGLGSNDPTPVGNAPALVFVLALAYLLFKKKAN
jgi:hypothetical protein